MMFLRRTLKIYTEHLWILLPVMCHILTNIIGFGSDGYNVIMGDSGSVKTRLSRDLPGIVILNCVGHSAHLYKCQAYKQIPESVEQLARDIYNLFKNNDKRQFDFRNFQSFVVVSRIKY